MRIGVLTYHCVPNFGAQLQTLSTVGFLSRYGYDPIVINWYPLDLELMYGNRVPALQVLMHNKFCQDHLPITKLCRTEDEVVKVIEEYRIDAIIHGSDALFKYQPERGRRSFSKRRLKFRVNKPSISVEGLYENVFWGGYLERIKRKIPAAIFAVSSQNCPYYLFTPFERNRMRQLLSNFCVISVRDEWTKKMLRSILHKSVEVSPDPVFSFEENNKVVLPSKNSIIKKYDLPEKYMLLSFRTNNLEYDYVQKIALAIQDNGFCPVAFPMPEGLKDYGLSHSISLPISPIDWYCLIKYSHGYIGERMHPIIVCIHNAVPFFSFDEYGTSVPKGLWMRKEFDLGSSKTYQLIEQSELLNNYCSYHQKEKIPNPKDVVTSICSFDFFKCTSFSKNKQLQYNHAMQRTVQVLLQNSE